MSQNADESDLKEDYPSQLRDSLRCQILLKLVLRLPRLTVIPRTVFEHMPLLEVLDLSSTSIQSLPSSVSSLSSLKELLLRDCSFLIELPIEIGMLTKLKLLDTEGSEIMYIPKELAELTDLEVLRLCLSQYAEYYIKAKNVNGGVKVPRMMISELKKLKELCISVCQEAEWWEKEIKEIQDEICHLEHLEFLKWYLPTDTTLKQFLDIQINRKPAYEKLSNFTFTIGQHAQLTSCLPRGLEKKFAEFEKCLKWINAEGNMYDISKIMTRAKALFLSRHWTIANLSAFDISKLKYFLLAECNEMETLVKIDDLSEIVENNKKSGLESLEYLSIHYMEKLKSIWEGPIGKDSLSRLRILALHTCLELTTIFTPRISQNLSCLAELTVEECPKVRSLIITPHSEHGPLFPSLERIFLIDLPELDHIFGGPIVLEKLESIMIYNCVKLRRLSGMELPRIQKIKGENKWWNSLNAYAPTWENVFEPLKEKSELIKQLLEATNSLQHFHDVVSREAKDEKPLDGPGLGAQETKTDPFNFPLRKEEGRFHTLPEAKEKNPLDGPGLGAQETKTDPFNFHLRKEEGRFRTLPEAKDKKPLDGPGLGAQETKTVPFNFPLRKEEGRFLTLPEAKDKKPLDGPGLGAQETKTDPFNFPLRKEEGRFRTLPGSDDVKMSMVNTLAEMELTYHNESSLFELGSLDSLLNLVSHGDPRMKEAAAKALCNLSSLQKNSIQMIKQGSVNPLVNLLCNHTSSPSLQDKVAAIIMHLAISTRTQNNNETGVSLFESDGDIDSLFSFISCTRPLVQESLLHSFYAMCHSPLASTVKAKLRQNSEHEQALVLLCKKDDPKVRTNAVKLFCCLTEDGDDKEIIDRMGLQSIETLINIIRSSGDIEEIASAMGVISNLTQSSQLTDSLLEADGMPVICQCLHKEMRTVPHKNQLIENAVGSIRHFTIPTNQNSQKKVASNGVIPLLVQLLEIGTSLTKKRSSICLGQLSKTSFELSRPIPRPLGGLFKCFSSKLRSVCRVHQGICTIESSFCLVEADAVSPLVTLLSDPDYNVCEASLDALLTLVEGERLKYGSKVLAEANAMHPMIKLLNSNSSTLQEKVLGALERIFCLLDLKQTYGSVAQMPLVELTQRGNNRTKSLAVGILAQLNVLHDQSSYF